MRRALGQRAVGAHAAGGEVPDAGRILAAVGVGVEVERPRVARPLEQADEVEGLLEVLGAEAVVLVEAADPLPVEVDVEELARPQRLPDAVQERQSRHRLVGDLGVDADRSGRSSMVMKCSACPTVGRKMSPRGSLGLGSIANGMS